MTTSNVFTKKKEVIDWRVMNENNQLRNIIPLNDVFVQYTFKDPKNTDLFVEIINYFIDYLNLQCKTDLTRIDGSVKLETQWEYILGEKVTRIQDFRAIVGKILTDYYIEIQLRTKTKTPIEDRGQEYFSFGLRQKGKEHLAHQIWLLEEGYPKLLGEQTCELYKLQGTLTGFIYPNSSTISFINLKALSKENSLVGDLSRFLLDPKVKVSPKLNQIVHRMSSSFEKFKKDKEAIHVLTHYDKAKEQAEAEGKEKGMEKGMKKGREKGKIEGKIEVYYKELKLTPEEIAKKINLPLTEVKSIILGLN